MARGCPAVRAVQRGRVTVGMTTVISLDPSVGEKTPLQKVRSGYPGPPQPSVSETSDPQNPRSQVNQERDYSRSTSTPSSAHDERRWLLLAES